jgi:hypothetical protein
MFLSSTSLSEITQALAVSSVPKFILNDFAVNDHTCFLKRWEAFRMIGFSSDAVHKESRELENP